MWAAVIMRLIQSLSFKLNSAGRMILCGHWSKLLCSFSLSEIRRWGVGGDSVLMMVLVSEGPRAAGVDRLGASHQGPGKVKKDASWAGAAGPVTVWWPVCHVLTGGVDHTFSHYTVSFKADRKWIENWLFSHCQQEQSVFSFSVNI